MTRILVPIDGSDQADHALGYALEHFKDADVVCLHVIDPIEAGYTAQASVPGYSEEWFGQAQQGAEDLFEHARGIASEYEHEIDTEIEVGRPSRTIVEYADENDVDHIVMGSHGREGVSRILVGSVAEAVMRRSRIPVTIVR